MVGFWFLEVTSLLYIVMTLNFFISGHMLPLDLLPQPWSGDPEGRCRSSTWRISRRSSSWARSRGRTWSCDLLAELLWAVVFMVLARGLYRLGLRRYSAFGG